MDSGKELAEDSSKDILCMRYQSLEQSECSPTDEQEVPRNYVPRTSIDWFIIEGGRFCLYLVGPNVILYHSLPISLCDSNYLKDTYKFSTEVLYYVISGQSKYTTISIVPCIRKFSNDLIFAFFAITFTLQIIAKY